MKITEVYSSKIVPRITHQIGVGDVIISDKARSYVNDVLTSRRLSHGKYLSAYESEFAKAHNVRYAVSCSSGTDAIRAAISCLKETENWKDGDEIIVPSVTFIATSNVVIQNNLKPIFVDIEKDYYGIDPKLIEAKITPRTKAIIVVHLFGHPCDMDPILAIATKHKLKIIEDSCETMFAKYKGRYVGTFGDLACFSSYACHIICTGVGGMVTTNNSKYATIVKSLLNHGRDSIYLSIDDDKNLDRQGLFKTVSRRFKFERLGYSSRLTEMEGALGLAQVEEREEGIVKRKRNGAFFTNRLSKFSKHLQLPKIRQEVDHVFMMYPIVVIEKDDILDFLNTKKEEITLQEMQSFIEKRKSNFNKVDLVNFLEESNIETRDMLPLLNQPVYKKLFGDNLESKYPVAQWINKNGFYIGSHPSLTDEEKEYIIAKFEEFFRARQLI